jgi:hypothetical protein
VARGRATPSVLGTAVTGGGAFAGPAGSASAVGADGETGGARPRARGRGRARAGTGAKSRLASIGDGAVVGGGAAVTIL